MLPSCVSCTCTMSLPAPMRFCLICSLVPRMVETMVMMAAMPMMMPSMVRNDRNLWLHTPCSARLIFSNIVTASLPAVQGIHGGFLRFGSGHHVPAMGKAT